MNRKLLVIFAATALSLAAKTYDVTFDQQATIGNVQLPPGHYSVKLDASTVHFMNTETGKRAEVTAKVSTANQKFDTTSTTESKMDNGVKVKEMDLGGTTTKLEFE